MNGGGAGPRAVILVEGRSDRAALTALARRRGRDLDADRVAIVSMDGVTNIGRELRRFGPAGLDVRLAGLYDSTAGTHVRRSLERAGLGPAGSGADAARLGFHACETDLEDELLRALGLDAVTGIVEREGELGAFRTLCRQPDRSGRTRHENLHRFLGSRSGRKERYAGLMVDALDRARVPPALDRVLDETRCVGGPGPHREPTPGIAP